MAEAVWLEMESRACIPDWHGGSGVLAGVGSCGPVAVPSVSFGGPATVGREDVSGCA